MENRIKNIGRPDERRRLDHLECDVVEIGDITVGKLVLQPGWRWSKHIRPAVGGEQCQIRHVGIVLSGRFGASFPDGTKMEMGPGDVFDIPPGHDGYTIGDEPCVQIEWSGVRSFGGNSVGPSRVLATLMFTDIVDSTATAARLGDAAWRELLSDHFESARAELDRQYGREVKTAGDGLLALFEGPAHALNCAKALSNHARQAGLSIRIGVHVGEVERVGKDVRGLAVHEAARIMSAAGAHEVVVSDLTRQLAAISGFTFQDKGAHVLKGLPGEWRIWTLS